MLNKLDIIILVNEALNYEVGWAGPNTFPISMEVAHNAMVFYHKMPENIFQYIDLEDIYPTINGTISIDIIKDNIEWCVEIGKSSFGSFTTVNGEYVSIIETANLSDIDIAAKTEFFKYINNDTTGKN